MVSVSKENVALALPQIKEQYLENLRGQFITELKDVIRVCTAAPFSLSMLTETGVRWVCSAAAAAATGREGRAGGTLRCGTAPREPVAHVRRGRCPRLVWARAARIWRRIQVRVRLCRGFLPRFWLHRLIRHLLLPAQHESTRPTLDIATALHAKSIPAQRRRVASLERELTELARDNDAQHTRLTATLQRAEERRTDASTALDRLEQVRVRALFTCLLSPSFMLMTATRV